MSNTALALVQQFKKLSAIEQREVCEAILRELANAQQTDPHRVRTIADIVGKYEPQFSTNAKEHDRGFAEAILQSKGPAVRP